MATYYSSRYALKEGGTATTAGHWIENSPRAQRFGELLVISGTYTFTGAEATNDLINLFEVPQYGKLLNYAHGWDDAGTTVTTDLEAFYSTGTAIKSNLALGTATTFAGLAIAEWGAQWTKHASGAGRMRLNLTSVTAPTATAVYGFVAQLYLGTSAYA